MTAHTASFLRPFRFSYCACLLVAIIASEAQSKAQTSTFQTRQDFDLAAEFPRQDAMADFDHDGNLDLAVTNFGNGGGRVDVHFGDGQSDFSSSYEITLTNAECIGLGDFDADGWMDMAVGGTGWATQAVYILRNDHLGGFVNMSTVYPLAWSPVGITTGDYNGDGHLVSRSCRRPAPRCSAGSRATAASASARSTSSRRRTTTRVSA